MNKDELKTNQSQCKTISVLDVLLKTQKTQCQGGAHRECFFHEINFHINIYIYYFFFLVFFHEYFHTESEYYAVKKQHLFFFFSFWNVNFSEPRNSLKVFLRYRVHKKGKDGQAENIRPPATAVAGAEA